MIIITVNKLTGLFVDRETCGGKTDSSYKRRTKEWIPYIEINNPPISRWAVDI